MGYRTLRCEIKENDKYQTKYNVFILIILKKL